ncbi:hypothetical protein ACU4GD_23910 [Cupriavidus basilensis]
MQSEAAAIASLEARLAALKQLQENVQTEGKVQPWLAKHGLAELPRLWKKIHIEPGWESALESVLREKLAALEVSQPGLDQVLPVRRAARQAGLLLAAAGRTPAGNPAGLRPLMALVQITEPGIRAVMQDWLADVYTAADMASARSPSAPRCRKAHLCRGRGPPGGPQLGPPLRCRFRAGRHAGSRAGNREPAASRRARRCCCRMRPRARRYAPKPPTPRPAPL